MGDEDMRNIALENYEKWIKDIPKIRKEVDKLTKKVDELEKEIKILKGEASEELVKAENKIDIDNN